MIQLQTRIVFVWGWLRDRKLHLPWPAFRVIEYDSGPLSPVASVPKIWNKEALRNWTFQINSFLWCVFAFHKELVKELSSWNVMRLQGKHAYCVLRWNWLVKKIIWTLILNPCHIAVCPAMFSIIAAQIRSYSAALPTVLVPVVSVLFAPSDGIQ